MRRGNQGKCIHRLDDGTLLGVNLGADFTAEHEWGIAKLKRRYGVDDEREGIEARIIRQAPMDLILAGPVEIKTTDYSGKRAKTTKAVWHALVSLSPYSRFQALDESAIGDLELKPYGDADLCGAWDDGTFGMLVKDESICHEIRTAIEGLDLCIGLFNGERRNPFSRSGLGLLIASRIPQEVKDAWLESDRDERRLIAAANATGIAERLKAAGKGYFALSPKWATAITSTKDGEIKSAHPVIYWLNPEHQNENNHGWFTVEQLDQWIEGKGPIPKREAA